MKASQHQEIEKTSLILSEKIPKLSEIEKAFVDGMLTGLQMNKAQPAPAAKEPEKQEEVKQMLENIFFGLLSILGIMILVPIIFGLAIGAIRGTIKGLKEKRVNK